MLHELIQTVIESLKELIGQGVKLIPAILTALVIIMLTRYVSQFTRQLSHKIGKKTIKSHSLQLLFSQTTHVFTWIIGIIIASVVAFPGLNLGDIVATLGLGSVAIGFAFQDIFKNFLAGILLLFQEPFRMGDQIIVDSFEGTVEKIDVRTTQIRTYQGEQILIPNATIFTSAVQVRTAFETRRTDLGVGVDYNTPLPTAIQILEKAIASVDGVLDEPKIEIDLLGFGDSSIDFAVRYWTDPQQAIVRRTQTKAMVIIKQELDKAGISIPYPIRTLYFYDQQKFNDHFDKDNESNMAEMVN
jgi:small-conductance mechanosensitive channel